MAGVETGDDGNGPDPSKACMKKLDDLEVDAPEAQRNAVESPTPPESQRQSSPCLCLLANRHPHSQRLSALSRNGGPRALCMKRIAQHPVPLSCTSVPPDMSAENCVVAESYRNRSGHSMSVATRIHLCSQAARAAGGGSSRRAACSRHSCTRLWAHIGRRSSGSRGQACRNSTCR